VLVRSAKKDRSDNLYRPWGVLDRFSENVESALKDAIMSASQHVKILRASNRLSDAEELLRLMLLETRNTTLSLVSLNALKDLAELLESKGNLAEAEEYYLQLLQFKISQNVDETNIPLDDLSRVVANLKLKLSQTVTRWKLATGIPPTMDMIEAIYCIFYLNTFSALGTRDFDIDSLLSRVCGCKRLEIAAMNGQVPRVRYYLPIRLYTKDDLSDLGNALIKASCFGHDRVVHLLLGTGYRQVHPMNRWSSDPTRNSVLSESRELNMALGFASSNGHDSIIQKLLSSGADVNSGVFNGTPALYLASLNGQISAVRLLLIAGANLDAAGPVGTALQAASLNGHESIVQVLVSARVDIESKGQYGTALQVASSCGHDSIVQLLLSAGANVNDYGGFLSPVGKFYWTALEAARDGNHDSVVQLLLEAGTIS
jgi:ankyrin repeat protein